MNNLTKKANPNAPFGELAIAVELQTCWQLGNVLAQPAYRDGLSDGALWGFIAGLAFSIAIILIVG